MAPGLYAGLKSRHGFPTPLPVRLKEEFYVNAGLIDGLSTALLRSLRVAAVHLRIALRGAICLQWYYLTHAGEIRHFSETNISSSSSESEAIQADIQIPEVLLADINIALIFFRVFHDKASQYSPERSELLDWCFFADEYQQHLVDQQPLRLISRSLGDSQNLIEQHLGHQLQLSELKKRFADLQFVAMPTLHIYESDRRAYDDCVNRIQLFADSHPDLPQCLTLFYNSHNLGGGGNMCLAMNESLLKQNHDGDFVMLDSDTLVPFKTLYSTTLISNSGKALNQRAAVFTPVIAYRKQPTKILEAGALFGRGAWQLAEKQPVQPCIFPFHHGADLSEKRIMGMLFRDLTSEYPPFIYGLYRLSASHEQESLLPAPFFLRGDDVEYGLHLKEKGIAINVLGSMLVFQDPKHSLWHELLAILHSTTILIAYTGSDERGLLSRHLSTYFRERMEDHASIHDLHGMSIYHKVLKRLLSLLTVEQSELLSYYYDPSFYLGLRSVNAGYNHLNYSMAKGISQQMPASSYQELPFLYFPRHRRDQPLPDSVLLMNHLTETAAVHQPHHIAAAAVHSACQTYQLDLTMLLNSLDQLHVCCRHLLDRTRIQSYMNEMAVNNHQGDVQIVA